MVTIPVNIREKKYPFFYFKCYKPILIKKLNKNEKNLYKRTTRTGTHFSECK
jgi:hypothetical protein